MSAPADRSPDPLDPDRPSSDPDAADRPSPLVSVDWLQAHLQDPDLVLVQVSPTRRVYNRRHLPRAVYGDLHRQLAMRGREAATGEVEREWLLPSREHVEAALATWGAGEVPAGYATATRPDAEAADGRGPAATDRHAPAAGRDDPTPASRAPRIVFYDDVGQNRQAIRGYWLLRLYRYPATRVHVLDGGLTAWRAAGGPETAEVAAVLPPARSLRLGELDPDLVATTDQVAAWSAEAAAPGGPTRILDVRSADEFVGVPGHGASRGGRIPGARNRLFSDFLRPDNTIRPAREALALVRGSGVEPSAVRAVYCQGGVRAALGWFVLHEVAGLDQVRTYAASWEEWGNRDDVPIESDVAPGSATQAAATPDVAPPAATPDVAPPAATPGAAAPGAETTR